MFGSTNLAFSKRLAASPTGESSGPAAQVRKRRTAAADDSGLIARLRAGEAAAFEVVVRQYGGPMLAVAKRFMREEEEARDVVQEAMLQAYRAVGSFRGDARLSTWLHRITVTTALMKLRSRRRRQEESLDDLLPRFADDGHWVEPSTPWEEEASELVSRRETRVLVRECIDRLPESHRQILLLRDIEDLDTREAAGLLGISENAVKVRLHRARQALRTLLEQRLRGAAAEAP